MWSRFQRTETMHDDPCNMTVQTLFKTSLVQISTENSLVLHRDDRSTVPCQS